MHICISPLVTSKVELTLDKCKEGRKHSLTHSDARKHMHTHTHTRAHTHTQKYQNSDNTNMEYKGDQQGKIQNT